MKKIISLVALATWASFSLAQTSLVGTYERYGTDLRNTVGSKVDYQPLRRSHHCTGQPWPHPFQTKILTPQPL
jgi:hypothetical protein